MEIYLLLFWKFNIKFVIENIEIYFLIRSKALWIVNFEPYDYPRN